MGDVSKHPNSDGHHEAIPGGTNDVGGLVGAATPAYLQSIGVGVNGRMRLMNPIQPLTPPGLTGLIFYQFKEMTNWTPTGGTLAGQPMQTADVVLIVPPSVPAGDTEHARAFYSAVGLDANPADYLLSGFSVGLANNVVSFGPNSTTFNSRGSTPGWTSDRTMTNYEVVAVSIFVIYCNVPNATNMQVTQVQTQTLYYADLHPVDMTTALILVTPYSIKDINAPMSGYVQVLVSVGTSVPAGQQVAVITASKMVTNIWSDVQGVVSTVFTNGGSVSQGQPILAIQYKPQVTRFGIPPPTPPSKL